jgi:hypothetical protein
MAATMAQELAARKIAAFKAGLEPETGWLRKTGATYPHHSEGECARRRRQIERGILRPNDGGAR